MHVLSIAQALVEQLQGIAAREGASRITEIHLRVGALSGVDPEALRLAFPVAAEQSIAEDAVLSMTEVPAGGTCLDCNRKTIAEFPLPLCEHCKSTRLDVTTGRDLVIQTVDLV